MTDLKNDKTTDVLTLLEKGSRIDSAHLKDLERTLAISLQAGRQFATKQGLPNHWDIEWQRHWDNVEKILDRTRVLLNEMIAGIKSHESDHLKLAMNAWEAIQRESDQLQIVLVISACKRTDSRTRIGRTGTSWPSPWSQNWKPSTPAPKPCASNWNC